MKLIELTQGRYTRVSDCDYTYLNQWSWYYANTGYAVRSHRVNGKCTTVLMHREIMLLRGMAEDLHVDHRDRDRSNNTRSNLRAATPSQNQANRQLKSKYRGVWLFSPKDWTPTKPWRATLRVKGKVIGAGYHKTQRDAARAYNAVAKKYFGRFAVLNIL